MQKVVLLFLALSLAGCAAIHPKPTIFVDAVITQITDCHDFKVTINGNKEMWRGCKLLFKTNSGAILNYRSMGENYFEVGQRVVVGLDDEDSRMVLEITIIKR